jgi:CelD/BcsL family acetyltransferase involved in cellulose biosynthesis
MPGCRWIELVELEDRHTEWRRLAAASEFPTAFADPAWILAWWQNFGDGHEPWTFVLEGEDGTLRGLAPLALERSGPTRTIRFAGGSWNGLETLICLPGAEEEFSELLSQALHERRREWELWRIQRLRTSSALARRLLGGDGCLRAAAHDLRLQPFLELPSDVDQFEARFGAKQRSTQRRKWRKLTELGADARIVEDPDQIASTLGELLALRRSRAIAQNQRHKHMDARYERFLLAAVLRLLPGGVRLWRLDLDGAMLASRLNLIQGSREHSYLLGLGDDHANLSPGNSLELQAIHEAIRQGRTELELGPGLDTYKYRLGARDREVARLVVSSGSPRGRLVAGVAAADLRLRDSRAAEALRRRKGVVSERAHADGRGPQTQATQQQAGDPDLGSPSLPIEAS